jgi:hypothetical protein
MLDLLVLILFIVWIVADHKETMLLLNRQKAECQAAEVEIK